MNHGIYSLYKDRTDGLLAPAREFNKLAVAQFEKLAEIQLASLQEYTELGLAQFKSVSAVHDAADVQDHLNRQNEFLRNIGEKFAADTRALFDLGKNFTEETQQIARGSVKAVTR